MNYFDIAIIVIVLLSTLIGFARGLFRTLGSMFSWLISLVIAILLAKVAANALLSIPFVSKYFIYNPSGGFSFYQWIYGILPDSLNSITMDQVRGVIYSGGELVPNASQALVDLVKTQEGGLMGMFLGLFKDSYVATLVGPEMMAYNLNNLGQGIALLLSNSLLILFSGILLLIVMKIITSIIVKLFERKIYSVGKTGLISRIFGSALGACKGICFSAGIMVILSFIINFSFMENPRKELLEKDSLFAGKFAEFVFEGTDKLLKTKDIDKIMAKSEFEKVVTFEIIENSQAPFVIYEDQESEVLIESCKSPDAAQGYRVFVKADGEAAAAYNSLWLKPFAAAA